MMNCKQVMTKLSTDENLSLMQKIDLKFHLMMCRGCSRFKQQLTIMKEGVENLISSDMQLQENRIKNIQNKVLTKLKDNK
ncbi:MAG: hypothetical protein AB7I27_13855 [Bacteriovoracaceae bacterium]